MRAQRAVIMGSGGGCTECYRLWQIYAATILQRGTEESELKLAAANRDGAAVARLTRAIELSNRALDNARQAVARHVAEHRADSGQ